VDNGWGLGLSKSVSARATLLAALLLAVIGAPSASAESWTALTSSNTQFLPDAGAPMVPVNLGTETAGSPITLDDFGADVVISPDARTGYAASSTYYGEKPCKSTGYPSDIQQIDMSGPTPVAGPKIDMSSTPPVGLALSPDGRTLYATSLCAQAVIPVDVSVATPVVGSPIAVGKGPLTVVVTPDGHTLYTANIADATVSVVDLTQPSPVVVYTIAVGKEPLGMALTPDGTRLYVADRGECAVTEIDTATRTANAIKLGSSACGAGAAPERVAASPDGARVYVTVPKTQTVTPIETATNTPDTPISFAGFGAFQPGGIAVTPDGKQVVVGDVLGSEHGPFGESVAIINEPGDRLAAAPIPLNASPSTPTRIAVTPDQAPVANFTVMSAPPGSPTSFDASSSTVRFGSIVSYAWSFGDGTTATTSTPTTTHVYASPGSYTATVTETDSAGTSFSGEVFTGQTASRVGGASAQASRSVFISSSGQPQVGLSSASLGFGIVGVGHSASLTLTIANSGSAPLAIASSSLSGSGAANFARSADHCTGTTVAAGASCTVTVAFSPGAAGGYTAQLQFIDNASGSPHTVSLTGTAITSGMLSGHVLDGSHSPATPVPGAAVQVCPRGESGVELGGAGCRYTSTDGSGAYSFSGLPSGSWAMQVEPPTAALFGASAGVQVAPGLQTQDFTLRVPMPLGEGLSVLSPAGETTSGIPVVNWAQPFEVTTPVEIPNHGPPDSSQPFAVEFTISVGGEEALGAAIFTVGYDHEGVATSVSSVVAGRATRGAAHATLAAARAHIACCQHAGDKVLYEWNNLEGERGVIGESYNGTPFIDSHYNNGTAGEESRWEVGKPLELAPPIEIKTPLGPIDLGKKANETIEATGPGKLAKALKEANQFRQKDPRQKARDIFDQAWKKNWEKATHGAGSFGKKILGPLGEKLKETLNNLYIDPSGTVHTRSGRPIAGARVVLSRTSSRGAHPTKVPNASGIMSPANRRNPDISDAFGFFGWDVLPGLYRVSASHRGCRSASTRLLEVPPPALDLSITLTCRSLRYAASHTTLHVARARSKNGVRLLSLIAHVAGKRGKRPLGTITFRAGARVLGQGVVNARTGRATLLTTLRGGLRVIASYSGDGRHSPSASAAVSVRR
jgi:DNA-binding beta-propeller fold protein YncE